MLHAVSLLASSSASSLSVPPLVSCLDGSSAEAHLSRCSSCRKKKNQFHRRCKDAITLHTEYKPVSRLTIWFQLNYLYTPYFQGWEDRFEAYLLMRCSLHWLGLVINYVVFFFCMRSGWASAGMFRSEHEGRGAQSMAAYTQSRDNVAKKAIVAMFGMTYHNEGLQVLVYISCSDSRNRHPHWMQRVELACTITCYQGGAVNYHNLSQFEYCYTPRQFTAWYFLWCSSSTFSL